MVFVGSPQSYTFVGLNFVVSPVLTYIFFFKGGGGVLILNLLSESLMFVVNTSLIKSVMFLIIASLSENLMIVARSSLIK